MNKRCKNKVKVKYGITKKAMTEITSGGLTVVASRPAGGKTEFLFRFILDVAKRSNTPIGFFSLEKTRGAVTTRLLALEAKIELDRVRSCDMTTTEWKKLGLAAIRLSKYAIYIDDSPAQTVSTIRKFCKGLSEGPGKPIIVVDYLQLMIGRHKSKKWVELAMDNFSEISRRLNKLSHEISTPILVSCQVLSEASKKKPQLEDLHLGTGTVKGNIADRIYFL